MTYASSGIGRASTPQQLYLSVGVADLFAKALSSPCSLIDDSWGLITTNFSTKFSSQRLREIVSRPVHEAEQALIPSPTARTSSWTGWSDVQHLFTLYVP